MASPTNPVSLSIIAVYARSGLKYGALLLVLFIVGRFFLTSALQVYKQLNPAPPPPPTRGFGALPLPAFPVVEPQERPESIVLETVGNRLPVFPGQLEVYFIPTAQPNLLALDEARKRAAALGFVFEPERISNNIYRWRRTEPIPAQLEIDIVSNAIDLQVDWPSSVTLLDPSNRLLPNEQQLTSESRTVLRQADLFGEDIATASPQIRPMRALAGQLKEVQSLSEADFLQVDIFRVTPRNLPTLTAVPNKGVVTILFSGSRAQGERVLRLESAYRPISFDISETYPLRTAEEAFLSLQQGGGFISRRGPGAEAIVRSVELAYYEPLEEQNYFQPVYVFRGDDGFEALLPALEASSYAFEQEPSP